LVAPVAASASSKSPARPARPSTVHVSSGDAGTRLSWPSVGSSHYTVEQSTDPRFGHDVKTYTVRGGVHQLAPYGLTTGRRYYFRVEARNGSAHSSFTSPASIVPRVQDQPLSVMTYNVLEATTAGKAEGGTHLPTWAERRAGVAQLIAKGNADVVAVQEAADWAGKERGPRQIDDLVSELGGSYALARTEIPPSEPHFLRTGCYILYKPSVYETVGAGGHWGLGNTRWAAYQVLENRTSHARFLMVAPHLVNGRSRHLDLEREHETASLIRHANAYNKNRNLPIVYAGDFNSRAGRHVSFDGAGRSMTAVHNVDSKKLAQKLWNTQFDSANHYMRRPPAYDEDIDHIYVTPGIGVAAWRLVLNLEHGKFVGTIPSDHNPLVANLLIPYMA
jgi:endonuclease/exonuclease/phosphatase family metal-dependent hydrolase